MLFERHHTGMMFYFPHHTGMMLWRHHFRMMLFEKHHSGMMLFEKHHIGMMWPVERHHTGLMLALTTSDWNDVETSDIILVWCCGNDITVDWCYTSLWSDVIPRIPKSPTGFPNLEQDFVKSQTSLQSDVYPEVFWRKTEYTHPNCRLKGRWGIIGA